MSLSERISEDIKIAMKAKDASRLSTLRMCLSALKYAEVDNREGLDGAAEEQVLASEAKKRREAIEAYEKGGDLERANQERAELEIIEAYLPEAVSDDEIEAVINEVLARVDGEPSVGNVMGPVMGKLKQLGGTVDGNKVREMVMSKVNV